MMISKMSSTSREQYVFMGEDTGVQVAFFFLELLDCILGENFPFF